MASRRRSVSASSGGEKKVISLATIQSALGNSFRITGLLATCLMNLFRPNVGLPPKLLENEPGGSAPKPDLCCGQPAYNSGDFEATRALARQVIEVFEGFDYAVGPPARAWRRSARITPPLRRRPALARPGRGPRREELRAGLPHRRACRRWTLPRHVAPVALLYVQQAPAGLWCPPGRS